MKFFLLFGALCGFALAFAAALLAGNETLIAFRNGAFGAMAGALMLRVFASVLTSSLRELAMQKAKEKSKSS